MSETEAVAAVAAAGGPQLPAENSVGISDWLSYMNMTATDITAWTEEILTTFDTTQPPKDTQEMPADDIEELSLANICGQYQNEMDNSTFAVYEEGGGVIVEFVHNPDAGSLEYDESSGVAFTNVTGDEITCTFSRSEDTIRVNGDCSFYGSDGNLVMQMTFSAVKID